MSENTRCGQDKCTGSMGRRRHLGNPAGRRQRQAERLVSHETISTVRTLWCLPRIRAAGRLEPSRSHPKPARLYRD